MQVIFQLAMQILTDCERELLAAKDDGDALLALASFTHRVRASSRADVSPVHMPSKQSAGGAVMQDEADDTVVVDIERVSIVFVHGSVHAWPHS